jgi:dihydroorotate dehydrogenase
LVILHNYFFLVYLFDGGGRLLDGLFTPVKSAGNRNGMKKNLIFKEPILNTAGTLGFVADARAPIDWTRLGAFITNPISLRRRFPSGRSVCLEYSGGFLIHSGLPNPGLEAILKRYSSQWNASQLPIIVYLIADRPEETRKMIQMLEDIDTVMGVELGFTPLLSEATILLTIEMCAGEIPLVASLPAARMLRIGGHLIRSGAAALSLAQPRGALITTDENRISAGRLFGPSIFPQSLEAISAAVKLELPIIGSGGIFDEHQAQSMLKAGAMAVQMETSFWLPKNKDLVA